MFQSLLDGSLSASPLIARLCRRLAVAVARRHDALVRYTLHGRPLVLPLSHDLPWNRRQLPLYSDNLRRLAAFVRHRRGALRMIDVGANIGDSWCLAGPQAGDAYLLVEGDARYFDLLARNTAVDPAVIRVHALVSDRAGEPAGALQADQGNARVVSGSAAAGARTRTLDSVLESQPGFPACNLLKVDVEGYDGRVLTGARRLLEGARPALFFEHHPSLIALAGDDALRIFPELDTLGYRRLLFYDNRGFLLGSFASADAQRLLELMRYALPQEGYYYDVCAFHEDDRGAHEDFLAAETAFYETRRAGGADPAAPARAHGAGARRAAREGTER